MTAPLEIDWNRAVSGLLGRDDPNVHAISIPFATLPVGYIRGQRYQVGFTGALALAHGRAESGLILMPGCDDVGILAYDLSWVQPPPSVQSFHDPGTNRTVQVVGRSQPVTLRIGRLLGPRTLIEAFLGMYGSVIDAAGRSLVITQLRREGRPMGRIRFLSTVLVSFGASVESDRMMVVEQVVVEAFNQMEEDPDHETHPDRRVQGPDVARDLRGGGREGDGGDGVGPDAAGSFDRLLHEDGEADIPFIAYGRPSADPLRQESIGEGHTEAPVRLRRRRRHSRQPAEIQENA